MSEVMAPMFAAGARVIPPGWAQLADYIVRGEYAIHNAFADRAADLGVGEQGWSEVQTAFNFFAAKQNAYLNIIFRIQKMMIGLLRSDSDRRKQQGANQHAKRVPGAAIPIPPPDHPSPMASA